MFFAQIRRYVVGFNVRTVHLVQFVIQTNKRTTYIFVSQDNIKVNTMHGTYIKLIEAQQAIMYNIYKNTKLKLLKK
jgi:hypothetical protein